jgi:multiple sugar transport system substrate-binding protein
MMRRSKVFAAGGHEGRDIRRPDIARTRFATTLVAGAAAAALILTGCTSTGAGQSEGPKEVVLANDNPDWTDGFTAMGEVTAKTTGFTIKPLSLPDTVSYTQGVLQSIGTNKSPDIVKWWSGKMLEALAASGNLQDLDEVWDEAVAAGNLDDALRPYYSYEGKAYGIPLGVSNSVHYYSKAAFQKAGITEVPQTLAEFEGDMEKLKAAGYSALCLPAADAWPVIMPYQTVAASIDPEFYTDLTQNKAKWNDPAGKKVLETISGWIKNGYTTSSDTKGADCAALMASGQVAITNFGTWANGQMSAAGMTDEDYGAFIAPSESGPGAANYFVEATSLAVSKNAPNKKAALDTLLAWLDVDAQTLWLDTTLDLPVNPNVTSTDPVLAEITDQLAEQKPAPLNRYYEAFPPKLVQSTIATLQAFMVSGDNPNEVADELQRQAEVEWPAWEENPAIG